MEDAGCIWRVATLCSLIGVAASHQQDRQ